MFVSGRSEQPTSVTVLGFDAALILLDWVKLMPKVITFFEFLSHSGLRTLPFASI